MITKSMLTAGRRLLPRDVSLTIRLEAVRRYPARPGPEGARAALRRRLRFIRFAVRAYLGKPLAPAFASEHAGAAYGVLLRSVPRLVQMSDRAAACTLDLLRIRARRG
jgi:hypothetical protein